MIPIPTRDSTGPFHKPEDWDNEKDGECGSLSVRVEMVGRHPYHISTWKPTQHELWALDAGGVVVLTCVGLQPPVKVEVELDGEIR